MEKESRRIVYDSRLKIEAYRFLGLMQAFPNHFHRHYTIGFIEKGKRYMLCRNVEWVVEDGDMLLIPPEVNHTCRQIDERTLDYKSINIPVEVMAETVWDITGIRYLPDFSQEVIVRADLVPSLKELHTEIMEGTGEFGREERYYFFMEQLLREYGAGKICPVAERERGVSPLICRFLEEQYDRNICLDELSDLAGMSKYHMLRTFTGEKGITPHGYLEAVRVERAKKLLEQGEKPIVTALSCGFHDQSHFTRCFKKLIGLTPGQYGRIFQDGKGGDGNC